jgi:hypothetical protein
LTICSDGGVCALSSGIGIVVAHNSDIISTNLLWVPSPYHSMSPYRCECFGILGAVYTFIAYKKFYSDPGLLQQLNLLTDSESMVTIITKYRYQPFTKNFFYSVDHDIIYEIILAIRALEAQGVLVTLAFVKGHQD